MLKNKKLNNAISRLNRIAGQINGVKRMVEENRDCSEVIIQIAAIRAALGQLGIMMMEEHLEESIRRAITTGKREELDSTLKKVMKQMLK